MNVDSVRSYCLSFPQSTEKLQWGETLCFKLAAKIFALLSLDSVPPSLCFKCTPEKFRELCEHQEIRPAPYLGRYQWVLLERLDGLGNQELEDLIRQSYDMVAAKAKVKVKAKAKAKGPSAKKPEPSESMKADRARGKARSRKPKAGTQINLTPTRSLR